jgi:hypothetical protein
MIVNKLTTLGARDTVQSVLICKKILEEYKSFKIAKRL